MDSNKIILDDGSYFVVFPEKEGYAVRYYNKENLNLHAKIFNDKTNLNIFKRYAKENGIPIEESKKQQVYEGIIRIIDNIRVIKEETANSEGCFFNQPDLLDNNQLIWNGELAYTMCDGNTIKLITKSIIMDITDKDNFIRKPLVQTRRLSKEGYKKWAEKYVNPTILQEVKDILGQYIYIPNKEDYDVVACWILHTYLFNLQGSTVYLHITGIPDSGKSTLQKILTKLTWNGVYVCSMSEAALFREVDVCQNTINIDEMDKWGKESLLTMQGILNNGYSKGGEVKRVNKETMKVESFRVFCPKTIATNNPSFLKSFMSRCIDIDTMRSKQHLKNIDCINDEDRKKIERVRDDICLFMLHKGKDIYEIFLKHINDPKLISNRTSQITLVLKCFTEFFNLDIDLEGYMARNKEALDNSLDIDKEILEYLLNNSREGAIVVTADQLSKNVTSKLIEFYDDVFQKFSIVQVGKRMKGLNFKRYKRQMLDGERKYNWNIPRKAIIEMIGSLGYDDLLIIHDQKYPNKINNTNNPNNGAVIDGIKK